MQQQNKTSHECPCLYSGRPLGKPYQGGAKFTVGHWDTPESHMNIGLGPDTYGMSEHLYKNPEGIPYEVPYPYKGATGAAMRKVFLGEPCCRTWSIGEESGVARQVCAMYTSKGIVGVPSHSVHNSCTSTNH